MYPFQMRIISVFRGSLFLLVLAIATSAGASQGQSEILKWKDGKKAAFFLMFDDGVSSHISNVIPLLEKNGFTGTFYLNPGASWFRKDLWIQHAVPAGMELANHTMRHCGASNSAQAEVEISECNEVILSFHPGRKSRRLVSFAYPGGSPWKVDEHEMETMLQKYNLIRRPAAAGHVGGMHLKTRDELVGIVKQALKEGSAEYLIFHGVGGDWLSTEKEAFTGLVEELDSQRENIWIADPISVHKYEKTRDDAKLVVMSADSGTIKIGLLMRLDSSLYDQNLTIRTRVPTQWKRCAFEQDGKKMTLPVKDGIVQYDAFPGKGEITLRQVD